MKSLIRHHHKKSSAITKLLLGIAVMATIPLSTHAKASENVKTNTVKKENIMKQGIFQFDFTPGTLEKHALRIFEARLKKRNVTADKDCVIKVVRNSRCKPEEFRLSGSFNSKNLQLDCGSGAAFLYAAGKLLRNGKYADGIFTPGNWRGSWNPAKSFRCVYIACHFYNVYEVSSVEFMEEYLEDLALLGYNYLKLGLGSAAKIAGSPEHTAALIRRKRLITYASELGMDFCHGVGNFGYADSPKELRATDNGHSFYCTEICTSNPAGLDYLEKKYRADCENLKDVKVKTVQFWSYDQGGCGCKNCFPYGVNGMFKLAGKLVPLIKEFWPDAKIMWVTWEFDKYDNIGEWETLYKKINNGEADFLDSIMADSHGSFPKHPLNNPLPGKVELVTFPEISMWGRAPWGGFGATPLLKRFSRLYGEVSHISSGGILYSEGIFEDINKFLYADMFATGTNEIATTIEEYANYELGVPETSLPDFKRLLDLLEENHPGLVWVEKVNEKISDLFELMKDKPVWRKKGKVWGDTATAFALAKKLDAELPAWAKNSWRWRLIYLRALIDFELAHNENNTNDVTEKAMLELVKIYNVSPETASRRVSPYTDEWIKHHVKEEYKINRKTIGVD